MSKVTTNPTPETPSISVSPVRAARVPFSRSDDETRPHCPDDDPRFEAGMATIKEAQKKVGHPCFSTDIYG